MMVRLVVDVDPLEVLRGLLAVLVVTGEILALTHQILEMVVLQEQQSQDLIIL